MPHAHTPGPWRVVDSFKFKSVVMDGQQTVCEIPRLKDDGRTGRATATAHLIAAAPEMLERLQGLCKQVETIMHQIHGLDHTDTHEALVKAYNTITRATGRERGE